MSTDRFDFTGADGQPLSGRLDLPDGPPHAIALFAHCFTCTKASVAAVRISRALTARGFGVLRFDFTGLGESGGDFAESTFSGSVRDVLAAAGALARTGRPASLLVGHSLGGAAVLAAAGELAEVSAVSVIGAPSDVAHVRALLGPDVETLLAEGAAEVRIGGRPFRLKRAFLDDLDAHDQHQRIAALGRALLILHSPNDQVVGIDNAASIFLAARHPKSFVSLDQADHLLTRSADAEYAAEVIAAWASRYIGAKAPLRSGSQPGVVEVNETGEGAFQVSVRAGGASFVADEPVEVGGLGSGPTPYDLLSAALGACTAMTLRMYASHKAMPLEHVRVVVGHTRDATLRPPDRFSREIDLTGPLEAAQRARLVEIAERCPVHRTLTGGAITTTSDTAGPAPGPVAESPVQHALDARDSQASDGERE